jgi:hypothetical protein
MQLLALASPAIVCVCVERGGIDSPGIFSLISRVAFESRMHASGTEKENVSAACCIVVHAEHDHESASNCFTKFFLFYISSIIFGAEKQSHKLLCGWPTRTAGSSLISIDRGRSPTGGGLLVIHQPCSAATLMVI